MPFDCSNICLLGPALYTARRDLLSFCACARACQPLKPVVQYQDDPDGDYALRMFTWNPRRLYYITVPFITNAHWCT